VATSVSLFVTGTDTAVGKTHTVVQLLRLLRASGLRCVGMKPICCGDRQDAQLLLAAGSEGVTIEEINPIWLKTPAAPFAAALVEHIDIDIPRVLGAMADLQRRFDCVVVEGVGGWLVPIRANYFVSDLAAEMKLPVLVVAQNRLGCLNHSMLTTNSVRDHGLKCAGLVINNPPGQKDIAVSTNVDILRRIVGVPVISGLAENMSELPPEWEQITRCLGKSETSLKRTQV
jgi:dethiobiotin synthetase